MKSKSFLSIINKAQALTTFLYSFESFNIIENSILLVKNF
jgi:hypothetical protein